MKGNASSTAELIAAELRDRLIAGEFAPGARLSEEHLAETLSISRNTLRESFRLLSHERLIEHRFNRGVFVSAPNDDDVADVFRVRRVLQIAAARSCRPGAPGLASARQACDDARRAAESHDWKSVGTANMAFHSAITATLGSARIDAEMRAVLAELRLAFHAMDDTLETFHAPYIPRNEKLLRLLEAGDNRAAVSELERYLDDAEAQLRERFRR